MTSGRIAALVGLTWLSACAGSPTQVERYRLTPAPAQNPHTTTPDSMALVLAVEPYATTGIYADPQIVYRVGEESYGAYPDREWALPLGTMLADATVETLRRTPTLGVQVTDDRVSGSHQLVWRGVVQQFEEVNRGDSVAAAVRLDVALVRTPGDSIVWQGTVGLERPVPKPTMAAIVDALSQLSANAIRQLVGEARLATQAQTVRLSEKR
jgi:ABC-type uncharacterized transport system auxiliary subunit